MQLMNVGCCDNWFVWELTEVLHKWMHSDQTNGCHIFKLKVLIKGAGVFNTYEKRRKSDVSWLHQWWCLDLNNILVRHTSLNPVNWLMCKESLCLKFPFTQTTHFPTEILMLSSCFKESSLAYNISWSFSQPCFHEITMCTVISIAIFALLYIGKGHNAKFLIILTTDQLCPHILVLQDTKSGGEAEVYIR
jgi:hypothetical protein